MHRRHTPQSVEVPALEQGESAHLCSPQTRGGSASPALRVRDKPGHPGTKNHGVPTVAPRSRPENEQRRAAGSCSPAQGTHSAEVTRTRSSTAERRGELPRRLGRERSLWDPGHPGRGRAAGVTGRSPLRRGAPPRLPPLPELAGRRRGAPRPACASGRADVPCRLRLRGGTGCVELLAGGAPGLADRWRRRSADGGLPVLRAAGAHGRTAGTAESFPPPGSRLTNGGERGPLLAAPAAARG